MRSFTEKSSRHRIIALLGLSLLLVMICSHLNHQEVNRYGKVYAAPDNELLKIFDNDDLILNNTSIANCRYGTVASSGVQYEQIPRFGAGWFLHFSPPRFPRPATDNNAEFVNVFKVFQKKLENGFYLPSYRTIVPLDDDLAAYIRAHPGELWIIGNEVDRGPNPGEISGGQGDMYPEIYAQAYHDVRAFIKKHDPSARTAISALVEVTPGRLQYLDKVWQAYLNQYGRPIPVDVWNMHIYILPELESNGVTPNGIANIALGTDPALGIRGSGGDPQSCTEADVYCYAEHDDLSIFREQVTAMRRWMKKHNQQQKPLILSEYSILYPYIPEGDTCFLQDEYGNCFTPDRVSNFMSNTFNLLSNLQDEDLGYAMDQNRLVQQWLWFAMYTERVGSISNLLEEDLQTMTMVGESYVQAVHSEVEVVNLVVDRVPRAVVSVDKSGKANATISVTFRNNGNTAVEDPFRVTFYADEERQIEIGSTVVTEMVRGCTTNVYRAAVTWPELAAGEYPFWVTIDSENVIVEDGLNNEDNKGSGLVEVFKEGNYVPTLLR